MIITLKEVKTFLKLDDFDDEDSFLEMLMKTAEDYLKNATGRTFDSTSNLARLFCLVLISDWYENRSFVQEGKMSDRVRYTIQSILLQLQYCEGETDEL